jgi:hypothetical protein
LSRCTGLRADECPEADFEPTVSPDGSEIAFVSYRDFRTADADLWLMNVDGGNQRRLTHEVSSETAPAWSPDGTRIAFVSDRIRGRRDPYVMNLRSGRVRRLTTTHKEETEPTWSPDGKRDRVRPLPLAEQHGLAPNEDGHFEKVTLKKGTFMIDTTALDKKMEASVRPQVASDATCSVGMGATAPVKLFDGTGLYKGISGNVKVTITFTGVGGRYQSGAHKGQCDQDSGARAELGFVTGRGSVQFN